MSFLDRINESNEHDLSRFRPLRIARHDLGWVRHDIAEQLTDYPDVFEVDRQRVTLNPTLDSFDERSAAVKSVLEALRDNGAIPAWRDEAYAVAPTFGAAPLLQMERAAFPCLGVRAYGVHLNGFVRVDNTIKMWIARRARDKPTYPGMFDNMVAGGLPIDITLRDNITKECSEEAGIPAGLAQQAIFAGAISYCKEVPEGLKPDVQFVCDLEVPPDFKPRPVDGEVEAFYLWSMDKVMDVVANTTDFKFNCALVIIDFLVRRGFIAPGDPDYLEIAQSLRR